MELNQLNRNVGVQDSVQTSSLDVDEIRASKSVRETAHSLNMIYHISIITRGSTASNLDILTARNNVLTLQPALCSP